MRLRPAVAADVPGLRALVEAAYAVYVPRIGLRPAPMDADYDDLVARGLVSPEDFERQRGKIFGA